MRVCDDGDSGDGGGGGGGGAVVAAAAEVAAGVRCFAATQREGKTRHCSARQAGGKASEVQSVALINSIRAFI